MTNRDGTAMRWALLVWAASALAIGTALVLEHGFGFAPCHLCLYERIPYYAVLGVVPLAAALRRPGLGLVLAGLLLLGNAGLSAYHVAVEQGLVALPTSCVAGGEAGSIEELRAQILNAGPTCDQATASFFGLSLATWNLLFAAGLGLASLAAAWRARSAAEQDRQPRPA